MSATVGHKSALQGLAATFAVPAIPAHVTAATTNSPPTDPAVAGTTQAKRPIQPPKTLFPEASMPVLFAKIKELNTGSLAVIVEGVYKELNAAIKKNAIEAKIREIGEKSKDGGSAKVWVVKPEIRVSPVMRWSNALAEWTNV